MDQYATFPGSDQAANTAVKAHRSRNVKACVQCRKLKKTCEGDGDSCQRCLASGNDCVYDKPQSSIVRDVGLARLASIEASLEYHERRLDTLMETVGELKSLLLNRLSPARSPHSHDIDRAARPQWTAFESMHDYSHTGTSTNRSNQGITTNLGDTQTGGLCEKPPTSLAPINIDDAFEHQIGQPINALAEAADHLLSEDRARTARTAAGLEDCYPLMSLRARSGSLKRRRELVDVGSRAHGLYDGATVCDLVSSRVLTDQQARSNFLLWTKEHIQFCPIFDATHDTYENVRARSGFLFDVIMLISMQASRSVTAKTLQRVASAVDSRAGSSLVGDPQNINIDTIKALLALSCFKDEPYIVSGVAVRLVLAARYTSAFSRLKAHGMHVVDEYARLLTEQFRLLCYALFLDFKHSRYTGRPISLAYDVYNAVSADIGSLCQLPFTLPYDDRHVANHQWICLEYRIMLDTIKLTKLGTDEQLRYVHDTATEMTSLYLKNDHVAERRGVAPLAYGRLTHKRIYNDALLYLTTNVLRDRLFDPTFPHKEIVLKAISYAHNAIDTVLSSPSYSSGVRYAGYLLRVDLSFAAMILLTLLAAHRLSEDARVQIDNDVSSVATLLKDLPDKVSYASVLQAAHSQSKLKARSPRQLAVDSVNDALLPTLNLAENPYEDWLKSLDLFSTGSANLLVNHDWLSTTDFAEFISGTMPSGSTW